MQERFQPVERDARERADRLYSFFQNRGTQMGSNQAIYSFHLKQIEDKMTFFQFRGRKEGKLLFYPRGSKHRQQIAFSRGEGQELPIIKWIAEREGGKRLPKAIKAISFTIKENRPVMTVSLTRFSRISDTPSSWILFDVSDMETTVLKTNTNVRGKEMSVSEAFKALQP